MKNRDLEKFRSEQAYRYFAHVREVVKKEHLMRDFIDEKRSLVGQLKGISYDSYITSSGYKSISDEMTRLIKDIEKYSIYLTEYVDEVRLCEKTLTQIKDKRLSNLLFLNFVMLKSWKKIAFEQETSISTIMKLRKKALLAAFEALPSEYRYKVPDARGDK